MPWTLDPALASSIHGKYVDLAFMALVRGAINIRKWSNKGGTQAEIDEDAVQAAIDSAELQIDSELQVVHPIPLANATTDDMAKLKVWAEKVASYELYAPRGLQEDDVTGNMLKEQRDEVLAVVKEFGDLASLKKLGASRHAHHLKRAPKLVI